MLSEPILHEEIEAWLPDVIAASLVHDIERDLDARIALMRRGVVPGTRAHYALQAQVLLCARERLAALAGQYAQRAQMP